MPAVAPSFVTSGTPLSSWFDPGPDYGTDPDSIDPATLPDGWTPQGAALMGGDVTRSPLEQAQWNMGLQGVANQFGQTQAANQFLQGAAGADPTTPDGLTSIERLLTPEAAADPRVQAYIREARLARQTALMGTQGRGAPLPPAGAAFLARLGTLDPSDPNAWNQLSSDVNAHPEWLQNPQVAADFKDFRDRRNAVMTRRNTQPKGKSEQDLEDMAAMAGIPYEEVPRTPEGAVDRYPLLQRIALARAGVKANGKQNLSEAEYGRLADIANTAYLEAPSDQEKLSYLQRKYGGGPNATTFSEDQWNEAHQARMPFQPANRKLRLLVSQMIGEGKSVPADLVEQAGLQGSQGSQAGQQAQAALGKPPAAIAGPPVQEAPAPPPVGFGVLQEQQEAEEREKAAEQQRQIDAQKAIVRQDTPLWEGAKQELLKNFTPDYSRWGASDYQGLSLALGKEPDATAFKDSTGRAISWGEVLSSLMDDDRMKAIREGRTLMPSAKVPSGVRVTVGTPRKI